MWLLKMHAIEASSLPSADWHHVGEHRSLTGTAHAAAIVSRPVDGFRVRGPSLVRPATANYNGHTAQRQVRARETHDPMRRMLPLFGCLWLQDAATHSKLQKGSRLATFNPQGRGS